VALVIQGTTGAHPRAGALVIGSIVLPLALYFVAGALRPAALAIDDRGLHPRRILGSGHIPWEAVRAFHVDAPPGSRAGPSLQAILHTGEVIRLPTPTSSGTTARRIADELTQALHEHAGPTAPRAGDGQAPAASSE
jgi:hypothetical protein